MTLLFCWACSHRSWQLWVENWTGLLLLCWRERLGLPLRRAGLAVVACCVAYAVPNWNSFQVQSLSRIKVKGRVWLCATSFPKWYHCILRLSLKSWQEGRVWRHGRKREQNQSWLLPSQMMFCCIQIYYMLGMVLSVNFSKFCWFTVDEELSLLFVCVFASVVCNLTRKKNREKQHAWKGHLQLCIKLGEKIEWLRHERSMEGD